MDMPGDLPNPGIEPEPPALQADSLPRSHWGNPVHVSVCVQIINYLTGRPEMQVERAEGKGENVQETEESVTLRGLPSLKINIDDTIMKVKVKI